MPPHEITDLNDGFFTFGQPAPREFKNMKEARPDIEFDFDARPAQGGRKTDRVVT